MRKYSIDIINYLLIFVACVWTWAEGHSSLCGDNLCTAIEVNSDPEVCLFSLL